MSAVAAPSGPPPTSSSSATSSTTPLATSTIVASTELKRVEKDNNNYVDNSTEEKKNEEERSLVGGRLKFFKDGRFLLELTHRNQGERGCGWVPIPKKVYWPPTGDGPATLKAAVSSISTQSAGSDSASNADASSIASPWSVPTAEARSTGRAPSTSPPTSRTRVRRPPRKWTWSSSASSPSPCFVMWRPPRAALTLRRRRAGMLRRQRRRPFDAIDVLYSVMKMEQQPSESGPEKMGMTDRDRDMNRKMTRLEGLVKRVTDRNVAPKAPLVQIQPWASVRAMSNVSSSSSSSSSVVVTSANGKASRVSVAGKVAGSSGGGGGGVKVKSKLRPVTETCTAATMPTSHSNKSQHHVDGRSRQTERHTTTTSSSSMENCSLANLSPLSSAKTLPVTATMARLKGGDTSPSSAMSSMLASSLISSSDLQQRVKVEIGLSPPAFSPSSLLNNGLHQTSLSPAAFVSPPRKRLMDLTPASNGNGVPRKKHRLSTESRGSSDGSSPGAPHMMRRSSSGSPLTTTSPPRASSTGSANPFITPRSHPIHQPGHGGQGHSFSIESIIGGDKSGRLGQMKRELELDARRWAKTSQSDSKSSRLGTDNGRNTTSPPLIVPISPYTVRSGLETRLDPRLAHLAGVAADPRLGLTPSGTGFVGSSSASSAVNPYYPAPTASILEATQRLAAAAAVAAAASASVSNPVWTPPVVNNTSPRSPSPLARSSSRRAAVVTPSPHQPSATIGWPASPRQYRGEPIVARSNSAAADLSRRASVDNKSDISVGDAPLNLSLKR